MESAKATGTSSLQSSACKFISTVSTTHPSSPDTFCYKSRLCNSSKYRSSLYEGQAWNTLAFFSALNGSDSAPHDFTLGTSQRDWANYTFDKCLTWMWRNNSKIKVLFWSVFSNKKYTAGMRALQGSEWEDILKTRIFKWYPWNCVCGSSGLKAWSGVSLSSGGRSKKKLPVTACVTSNLQGGLTAEPSRH